MRTGFMERSGVAIVAAAGLAIGAAATAQNTADFRVLPYLMSPTAAGVTVNWFSFVDAPGSISITGPGLASPLVLATAPALQPVLDYVFNSENSPTVNPADGRVYFAGAPARNWKHSVVVGGLQPGATYTYTVTQGGSSFTETFETAPLATTQQPIRLTVMSDSETLVVGRTTRREWSRTTPQRPGSTGRPATGPFAANYLVTETLGYQENIKAIKTRNPDLIVMPGDLIQGTNTEQQRRWDEFWRHNAGEYDTLLSRVPLVAAIGNNCIFLDGANSAGLSTINQRLQFARQQWSAYFDFPAAPNASMQDLYHRTDYGPITIITLCVVKAVEEANHLFAPDRSAVGAPLSGANVAFPSRFPPRDTNRAWFDQLYTFGDYPDFNVGTEQWNWAIAQLADARAQGQVIFVQWHHTPYSRGVHGSFVTSNQSGEATRIYTPILEQYRVAGVFCGHSEVKERSFVDANNDGYGIHYWDVGAAGDGLRGVEDAPGSVNPAITAFRAAFDPNFQMNPFSQWSADQSEPELWQGNTLLGGGKHYGFLEVDVVPLPDNRFRIRMQPYHVFPLNDNLTITGFDLRRYSDLVVLEGPANNLQRVPVAACAANCDGSTASPVLNALDFSCFLGRYQVQDPVANCDGSTTIPVINALDFACFLQRYVAGCP